MAKPELKVAVEFDGPVHYFANAKWMLTGRSKLKRRLLDLVGWDIVYVDYRDWLCGIQPLVWVVLTKLQNSLARSNRSRFG